MRRLAGRALVLSAIAVSACSDPSAPGEDVGHASTAIYPPPIPWLGRPEDGWRMPSSGDYNGDGVQDVLWRNQVTNTWAVSLMRGTGLLEQGPLMAGTGLLEQGPTISGPTDGDWSIGNVADCNGDGMSELIWLGTHPLRMRVWLMREGVPVTCGPVIRGPSGT